MYAQNKKILQLVIVLAAVTILFAYQEVVSRPKFLRNSPRYSGLSTLKINVMATSSSSDSDFTIILFPDIQNMVQYHPRVWESEPNWVKNNLTKYNIKAVIGLGDNCNQPTDDQMNEAQKGWNTVDSSGLPYVICIGNHDYDYSLVTSGSEGSNKSEKIFNSYFGTQHYNNHWWYGGSYSDTSQDYYVSFTAGERNIIILSLEYFPTDTELSWAQKVVSSHPTSSIIVATHAYLDSAGNRLISKAYASENNGQQIWTKFIKNNPNIFLVVCGHIGNTTSVFTPDSNVVGNTVDQLRVNYQDIPPNGGNGFMEILTFHPPLNTIETIAYSDDEKKYDSTTTYLMPWGGEDVIPRITNLKIMGKQGTYSARIFGKNFGTIADGLPFYGSNPNLQVNYISKKSQWDVSGADSNNLQFLSWSDSIIIVNGIEGAQGDSIEFSLWNPQFNKGTILIKQIPYIPSITNVSFFKLDQNIGMNVHGVGFGASPVGVPIIGNLDQFCFYDNRGLLNKKGFQAGFSGRGVGNKDSITLAYKIWTDTNIIINGFGGTYGQNDNIVNNGDSIEIIIWNTTDTTYNDNYAIWTGVVPSIITSINNTVPIMYDVSQNYPNPFNPSTSIKFYINKDFNVRIILCNVLGQQIYSYDFGALKAGNYARTLDMKKFGSGIYYYTLEFKSDNGAKYVSTKKMLLLK